MRLRDIYSYLFIPEEGKRKAHFHEAFPYNYDKKDVQKKIETLLIRYESDNGSDNYSPESFAATVESVVREYTNNKDALIKVYKVFAEYLSKKGYDVKVNFPPVPISNTFERLMFEAKYLQDSNHSISKLPAILWQSERTIETDIRKLRGLDDDPIQVCGKKFIIPETDRSMGHISFGSTAHPIFLTCNLTQVMIMLNGLKNQCENSACAAYAMQTAQGIWGQLSEYAKERICYVTENLFKQDATWYKSLESSKKLFYSELDCSNEGGNALLMSFKNGDKRNCVIEYQEDTNTVFYENVNVLEFRKDGVKVIINGEEKVLDPHRIIRSSYHTENMF